MTARPLGRWDGQPVSMLSELWGVPLLEAYATIGSTNDRALELAAAGAEPYTVVVADKQTAGRGRRGRGWSSAPGQGLLLSLVLPSTARDRLTSVPLLAGLATAGAIEQVAPEVTVQIKWPNDLWIGGRKVAGVLCEAANGGTVVGVGINVRTLPAGFDEAVAARATSLEGETGKCFPRHELAHAIARRVEQWLPPTSALPPTALSELARRDGLVGLPLLTESEGSGTGAGFAEDGALLIRRSDGSTARVVAGSVRLR